MSNAGDNLKKKKQVKNMALYGMILGVFIGLLIYFLLAYAIISFYEPQILKRPDWRGWKFFSSVINVITINTNYFYILLASLIIGSFIGFFLIPI